MKSIEHVAIIMDGNGRWAKEKFRPRVWGHIRGAHVVSQIVEEADLQGVKALTLYAFSTENWSRPLDEIKILLKILDKFLKRERDRIIKNKIKFKVMGDLKGIPEKTLNAIIDLQNETKLFHGLKLTFAFGYGSRDEIVKSINKFIDENPGKFITEESLEKNLYNPETGDVDLLIRTGGDERISNFLLWQIAYAELFFTPTKWPQFSRKEFKEILNTVSNRERRFGSIKPDAEFSDVKALSLKNKDNLLEARN